MKNIYRPILPLIMPVVVISAAFIICGKWPGWTGRSDYARQLKALSVILPQFPYVLLGAGLLLGWCFRQTGMVLSAWLLGVTYWAVHRGGYLPGSGALQVLACLVFLEIAIFSSWRWRQLPLKSAFLWLVVILLQTAAVAVANRLLRGSGIHSSDGIVSSPLLEHVTTFFRQSDLSVVLQFLPVLAIFYFVGFYLLFLAFQRQDVLAAGLLGVLFSAFLAVEPIQTVIGTSAAFSIAGLILLLACVEASFVMAYRDELTGLPSRRALNQTLAGLGPNYTIAMIDVDHFKRFNDTYGHKAGDQVLKLLAARLTRMSGGARPFRYGGEEFTAVFPGKSLEDALPYLEACRQRLSGSPFVVRGKARRNSSADRRGEAPAGKARKQVKVTASFGVAESSSTLKTPAQVITAADRALYRAKKAGRNCVKT